MAGQGQGSSGRVRPASLHSSGPLYVPGSRPSAGSPRSFHRDGDFLAAKKMGSMSASMWCLAASPGGAGTGEDTEPAEPQEADVDCGELGDHRRPVGSSVRPGGWGSPAGVGSAGRLPAGLVVILRFLSRYFVCTDHTFLWLKFCSERSPPPTGSPGPWTLFRWPAGSAHGAASCVSFQSFLMQIPENMNKYSHSPFSSTKDSLLHALYFLH